MRSEGENASGICPGPIAKSRACALRSHHRCAFGSRSILPPRHALSRPPHLAAFSLRGHPRSRRVTAISVLRHRARTRLPPASSSSSLRASSASLSQPRSPSQSSASASECPGLLGASSWMLRACCSIYRTHTAVPCAHDISVPAALPQSESHWLPTLLASSELESWLSGPVPVSASVRLAAVLTQRLSMTTCPPAAFAAPSLPRAAALRAINVSYFPSVPASAQPASPTSPSASQDCPADAPSLRLAARHPHAVRALFLCSRHAALGFSSNGAYGIRSTALPSR